MSKTATAKKAATTKATFQTIQAVCTCTADVLSRFQDSPLTRYELGFQSAFEELGGCFIRRDTAVTAQGSS